MSWGLSTYLFRQSSLVARQLDQARADLGDFGRTEPVAIIDTLGVDPSYAHLGVGHALLSQLFLNLGALHIERVETVVDRKAFELLGFFYDVGFAPGQRLAFVKKL